MIISYPLTINLFEPPVATTIGQHGGRTNLVSVSTVSA